MSEFLNLLASPEGEFMRRSLLVGIVASVAFGVVGTYVVVRRITVLAGAISHSALAGVGGALLLGSWTGLPVSPLPGGMLAALVSASLIGWMRQCGGQREDTAISAVWSVGMAVGLLCFSMTPRYVDPMGYLFGDVLMIRAADVWTIVLLALGVVAVGLGLRNGLVAVAFDEEFCRVRGLTVGLYSWLLLAMVAVSVVLLAPVVGVVMVMALMALPAAAAGCLVRRLEVMMVLASVLCAVDVVLGLWASYVFDVPAGPAIILFAAGAYLLAAGGRVLLRKPIF